MAVWYNMAAPECIHVVPQQQTLKNNNNHNTNHNKQCFSDVVVAQSRENMAVWYNMDAPERVTLIPIKGDIVDIVREDGKTEVIVQVVMNYHFLFKWFFYIRL